MSDKLVCPHCSADVTEELMEDVFPHEPNECYRLKTLCPNCDADIYLDVDIYIGISETGFASAPRPQRNPSGE